jgi:hypothetical protein
METEKATPRVPIGELVKYDVRLGSSASAAPSLLVTVAVHAEGAPLFIVPGVLGLGATRYE